MADTKAADGGPPIPDWAAGDAASEAPFVLEVIKAGVPVDEIPLTAARCLVGRAASVYRYGCCGARRRRRRETKHYRRIWQLLRPQKLV